MAYVWREHKLIFFAAPATGSTAFIDFLRRRGLGESLPAENIDRRGKRLVSKKHSTLETLREHGLWEDEFDGYVKAVGVRNPFAWHVATYNRLRTKRAERAEKKANPWARAPKKMLNERLLKIETAKNQTFETYLRERLEEKRPRELQNQYHVEIDFYIHQERLADDAAKLFERIGAPQTDRVGEVNVTGKSIDLEGYKAFYTPELIALVYTQHKPFFERFPEYSFEGLDASRIASPLSAS
jgi:hypothetical protein